MERAYKPKKPGEQYSCQYRSQLCTLKHFMHRAWAAYICDVSQVNAEKSNLVVHTLHVLNQVFSSLFLRFIKTIRLYFTKRLGFTSLYI